MRLKLAFILFVLTSFVLLAFVGIDENPPVDGKNYVIDPGHTAVTIRVKRFGVVDVLGRFQEVSGKIQFNESDHTSITAEVVVKVDSYHANNSGGEDAVKSAAFLDATNYPEIAFKAKRAYQKEGQNMIVADLTIHGTTNEVEFPFKITGPKMDLPTQKQSIAIEGSLVINRQDYGISFDRKLPDGGDLIGNEVKIELIALAIEE